MDKNLTNFLLDIDDQLKEVGIKIWSKYELPENCTEVDYNVLFNTEVEFSKLLKTKLELSDLTITKKDI